AMAGRPRAAVPTRAVAAESAAVDERGDVACAESVINVYDADVGGAGVHHSQQSGQALEGRAIAYAGRNRNHRDPYQAADYAGQSALHSSADYDHTRCCQGSAMGQQAVNAGYSYVVDVLNFVAHQFGGDHCLFGDRDVAGTCGHDHDHSLTALLAIAFEDDGTGEGTILCSRNDGGDCGVLFFGGSRCEHVAAVGG